MTIMQPQYSTVVTYQEYREWRRQSVAQRVWGAEPARPPLNPPLILFAHIIQS